jgi:hypothetical protein
LFFPNNQERKNDKSRQILDNRLPDDGRPNRPEGKQDKDERVHGAGDEVGPDDPGGKGAFEHPE